MPPIELSHGELLDRQTILELKRARAPQEALPAVVAALGHVRAALAGTDVAALQGHVDELRAVNARLWDLEDEVRRLLADDAPPGREFTRAAAEIPALNDRRAAAKRAIDRALGHAAPEVKVHPAA
jgi:hypothetical protein